MINELEKAYNAAVEELNSQKFYRKIFAAALNRANIQARSIAAKPPPRSRFAKWLGTMSKSQRAKFLANWNPFRMLGAPRIGKGRVNLKAETGMAEYLYLQEIDPADEIVVESVSAELLANADEWMHTTIQGIVRGNTEYQIGRSRESGT